jgi:hypothetical protein
MVAVGHTILPIAYHLRQDPASVYDERCAHDVTERARQAIERDVVRRLQQLGNTVVLHPVGVTWSLGPSFSEHAEATYELPRPLVLFGQPVRERARETGVSDRTLCRNVARFAATEMRSLFAPDELPTSARGTLPLGIRKAIVERNERASRDAFTAYLVPPGSCRSRVACRMTSSTSNGWSEFPPDFTREAAVIMLMAW